MPGFSGTGPMNEGPMTGRGRGYCVKEYDPQVDNFYRCGRGRRMGRGMAVGKGLKQQLQGNNTKEK
ncbi:MAG: DUF5320 domain-containing protein [Peptococcales bacterium]|jgi:hypothetical protein